MLLDESLWLLVKLVLKGSLGSQVKVVLEFFLVTSENDAEEFPLGPSVVVSSEL